MWKLIKIELHYNRIYVIIGAIFFLLVMIPIFISGDVEKDMAMYSPISFAFWMFIFGRWGSYMFYKDNLERVHASLPLAFKDIAKSRLLVGIILWFCYLTVVITTYYFFTNVLKSINIWGLVFINGLAIIFNAFIFIWHDFIFIKQSKYRKRIAYIFYFPVAFSAIALIYFSTSATLSVFSGIQTQFRSLFFNSLAGTFANILGIGMTLLSYYMYQNRYSYLVSEFGIKANIKVKTGDIS